MKRLYWVILIVVVLVAAALLISLRGNEDSWIQDSRGVWIKHGAPAFTPDKVLVQQQAVSCAKELYDKHDKSKLESQCLGTCFDYAVDIVHVPRTSEDDKLENQCEDFTLGRVTKFIELDKEGSIQRIYE